MNQHKQHYLTWKPSWPGVAVMPANLNYPSGRKPHKKFGFDQLSGSKNSCLKYVNAEEGEITKEKAYPISLP